MKWDLEDILYPEYLNKLLDSKNSTGLIGFMFKESRKTESYSRAMAIGLNSYQVTTTQSVFDNTGIYMMECSMEKKPIVLIGTSDMLFKLDLEAIFKKRVNLNIVEVIENYSDIDSLDEKYLKLQNILNHKYIHFDSDKVFCEFLSVYSSYINCDFELLNIVDINILEERLKPMGAKFNLLYFSTISQVILRNYDNLVQLSSLSKYFNTIYIKLDEHSLGYMLCAYSAQGFLDITNLFHKHNIYFKVVNENSSMYALKDFITLLQ